MAYNGHGRNIYGWHGTSYEYAARSTTSHSGDWSHSLQKLMKNVTHGGQCPVALLSALAPVAVESVCISEG
eukprot:3354539-Amphidinium_carterae.1